MLIYYLTGYPPKGDTGGGGLANTLLMDKGTEFGHSIEIYDCEDSVPDTPPDLYWLSSMNGRFDRDFIRDITDNWRVPFIVQDDAYQNLCPQPTREYKLCFQDRFLNDTWSGYIDTWRPSDNQLYDCTRLCRYELMQQLMSYCKASISVSPMHGNIWRAMFPQIEDKQIIVEPQINVDMFRPTFPPERYTRVSGRYLYVSTVAKGKGYYNCIRYVDTQGGELVTCGDIHHTVNKSDVKNWIGHIPYSKLPVVYSNSEYLIHLPEWPEPQGRNITEALLCGCKIIANNKVGALSYPWLDQYVTRRTYGIVNMQDKFQMVQLNRKVKEYRARIADAPSKFWRDLSEFTS